jgi:hypothetical protein
MLRRRANNASRAVFFAAASLFLPLVMTGCRDSAPDDLIQQEPTTEALVFVNVG